MSFEMPNKTKKCKLSAIREVIQRGKTIPGFISLAIGNPAEEAVPVAQIQAAAKEVIDEQGLKIMQYGPAYGVEKFVALTTKRLVEEKGFSTENHGMVVLNGSNQGLGLVARSLTNPGDEVYAEQFSFTSAVNSVRCVDAKVVGIDTDEYGMIPDALREAAKSGKGKYIYLNPTFQNPTGLTMPLERRKEIYEVAREFDLLIYEDDPYGEIRFSGEPVPCFKNIDEDGRVLYAGSYSKILTAGLRVGYIFGHEKYVNALNAMKNVMDGECPQYNQLIITKTVENMDFKAHIEKLKKIYGDRCQAMLSALKRECSSRVKISEPEGGMFIWVTLPEDVDNDAFYEALFDEGVGAVKSGAFACDESRPGNAFRLNYTYLPFEQIEEGAKRFARVTKKLCGE